MPNMTVAIQTKELCRDFGDNRAVDGLNLKIESGAFYGLLGPNGAGKSTTVAMLTGSLRPSSGNIEILGRAFDPDDPFFKLSMGVVSEEPPLFERLRGPEQLVFTGRMYGLARQVARQRAGDLLSLLGLDAHPGTLVADYSRGMKKKLAIACALIHAPRLLFFDEPFEGVDASSADTIRKVLEGLTRRGATVLLTTHIMEVAENLCHKVGIINNGHLAHETDMDSMKAQGLSLGDVFRSVVGDTNVVSLPAWLMEQEET